MQFLTARLEYDENHPFTSYVNEIRGAASSLARTFFTQSTLNRAICRIVGPFTCDTFQVQAGEMMVEFEAPQPPAGTEQAILYPRPRWYAILQINRSFISPKALFYSYADPNAVYQPGDQVAIWFNVFHPACIVGKFRDQSDPLLNPHNSPMPGIQGFF